MRRYLWVITILAVLLTACLPAVATPANGGTEAVLLPPTVADHAAEIGMATPVSASTPIPATRFLDTLSAVEYRLPLTLRHVTETSATLYFELTVPSDGVLVYAPVSTEQGSEIVLSLDSTREAQLVTLDNLSPGTEYQIRVGIATEQADAYEQPPFLGELWGPLSFQTVPVDNDEPVRIGLIGDSGFGDAATASLAQEMAAYNLDFVMLAGDVVYNINVNRDPYEAFAQKYYTPLAPLLHTMPIYTVVGNHDVEPATLWEDVPFYYHAFPAFDDPLFEPSTYEGRNQWYAFGRDGIQFVMLDTQTFFNEPGRAEQTAWLAERLADNRFRLTVPVFHVAPYTSGRHTFDGLAVRSEWQGLFEAAGLPLILSGHDHNYERLSVNGITYIVSGGGSTHLYPLTVQLPESMMFAQETHFVLIEIFDDRIEIEAVALGGSIIDQAVIALP